MRYVPSTPTGSLLMGSIRQAAHEAKADPETHASAIADALTMVEAFETGDTTRPSYKALDATMSGLFQAWAKAIQADDSAAAAQAEQQLDALATKFHFSFADTRGIYGRHASTADAKLHYRAWKTHPAGFGDVTARLKKDARVAILGDWGTGEDDANALVADMLAKKPDVILHLGDIYDAGVPLVIEGSFRKPINDACKALNMARPPIFTIPGNHEYYSGGKGFFELIDVLNQDIGKNKEWAQDASYFCLRTEDDSWQFLGADTGLDCIREDETPVLVEDEAEWHTNRMKGFAGKTVFMTHHQLVNAHHRFHRTNDVYTSHWNTGLVDQFKDHLPGIDLWIWGHDHWFIPYAPDLEIPVPGAGPKPKLRRGQLMGGSARETTVGQSVNYNLMQAGYVIRDPKNTGQSLQPGIGNPAHKGAAPIINHTYAILELGTGVMSYYEVPGWSDRSPDPVKKDPIAKPFFVEKL